MANTRITLPFDSSVYRKTRFRHKVEITLQAIFEFLAGFSAFTSCSNLAAVFGIKLVFSLSMGLGSIFFVALVVVSATVGLSWSIYKIRQYLRKSDKEIALMKECDQLNFKINQLIVENSITLPDRSDYQDIDVYNSQPETWRVSIARLARRSMAFLSGFNTTIGIATLLCAGVGMMPLFMASSGLLIVAALTITAVLMGVVAIGAEVYFKRTQKNRLSSLKNKINVLKKTKRYVKKTIIASTLIGYEKKLKKQHELLGRQQIKLNHYRVSQGHPLRRVISYPDLNNEKSEMQYKV